MTRSKFFLFHLQWSESNHLFLSRTLEGGISEEGAQEWDLLSLPWVPSSLPGPVLPPMQDLSAVPLPLSGRNLFLGGVEHL